MSGLKGWLQDFPGHPAGVATALLLILVTGVIVDVKLVLGQPFPDGYEPWLWVLLALAGVNVVGMGIKRATDIEYRKAGTSPVTVEAPSTVTVAPIAPPPIASAPAAAVVPPAVLNPPREASD